jgi:hypothetical protein
MYINAVKMATRKELFMLIIAISSLREDAVPVGALSLARRMR